MADPSLSALLALASAKAPDSRTPQSIDILAGILAKELQSLLFESLDLRIQALPQELQDAILELTIAVKPADDGAIHITTPYKPPLGLQLNHEIRDSFAKSYYGSDTIFHHQYSESFGTIVYRITMQQDTDLFRRWLFALNLPHRNTIETIRLKWETYGRQHISPINSMVVNWACHRLRASDNFTGPDLIRAGVLVCYMRAHDVAVWYRTHE